MSFLALLENLIANRWRVITLIARAIPAVSPTFSAAKIPSSAHVGISTNQVNETHNLLALYLGVTLFFTASPAAMKTLALTASSAPPLTNKAAVGLQGAASIHLLPSELSPSIKRTSISSISLFCMPIANANP